MMRPIKKVCCIGAGYVGGPTCAVIARQAPDVQVAVVDLNQARIDAWNSQQLPVYEPGLDETVKVARDGTDGRTPNLIFTTDMDRYIDESDLIFIAVNTPTKMIGFGAERASDLQFVESAVRKIASVARSDKIIVEKSTVPCRTAATISSILSALVSKSVRLCILSNPEFLAEGTAIKDLMNPDRVLIGCEENPEGHEASQRLKNLYARWITPDKIITMDVASSELAKLAANAYLAQRISSINSLSAICEAAGADIENVSRAIGADSRIGSKFLKATVGFGGSCFQKDVLSLVWLAQSLHLPQVAAYWEAVVLMNDFQMDRFSRRIISGMNDTLTGKRIAVLGFAYKKNTGDTRMSPAITLIRDLLAERAMPAIFDPQVRPEQIEADIRGVTKSHIDTKVPIEICNNAYEACTGADAVVVLTDWDCFHDQSDLSSQSIDTQKTLNNENSSRNKGLDWSAMQKLMRVPAHVFDGRNMLNHAKLRAMGFHVHGIGKAGY